jgi:hypothetical protein
MIEDPRWEADLAALEARASGAAVVGAAGRPPEGRTEARAEAPPVGATAAEARGHQAASEALMEGGRWAAGRREGRQAQAAAVGHCPAVGAARAWAAAAATGLEGTADGARTAIRPVALASTGGPAGMVRRAPKGPVTASAVCSAAVCSAAACSGALMVVMAAAACSAAVRVAALAEAVASWALVAACAVAQRAASRVPVAACLGAATAASWVGAEAEAWARWEPRPGTARREAAARRRAAPVSGSVDPRPPGPLWEAVQSRVASAVASPRLRAASGPRARSSP